MESIDRSFTKNVAPIPSAPNNFSTFPATQFSNFLYDSQSNTPSIKNDYTILSQAQFQNIKEPSSPKSSTSRKTESNESDNEENSLFLSESEKASNTPEFENSVPVFQYRKKTKLDNTIKPLRANLLKVQTMGLSTNSPDISFRTMKMFVKKHKDTALKLLKKYKEIDNESYEKFVKAKVYDEKVKNMFNQFYKLRKNYSNYAISYFLNSYDEDGVCRVFESFFLEFDSNFDRRMEMDEMVKCIELLAKDQFVGKEKMIETLKLIEIFDKNSLNKFREGEGATRLFSEPTYIALFQKFCLKILKNKSQKATEFIDFHKFSPLVFIFFLEYIAKLFLRKSEACQFHLGVPLRPNKKGKLTFDPSGIPQGLYKIFIKHLNGENDINKSIVTFDSVIKTLILYRAQGLSNALTMESIERIINDVKQLMRVDSLTYKESRLYTMKEILPYIASKIYVEINWSRIEYKKSIEKYDDLVTGLGGTLASGLSKKKLDRLLTDAFCFLPFPNFPQFVKGLDFILHRAIPTLVSPASIFIANGLIETPDAVIIEDSVEDNKNVVFNIEFIIKHDDLFERLNFFTFNIQFKLSIIRLLYKDHLSEYKRSKNINRNINIYNDIIKNSELFEDIVPGKFGKFEDANMNLVKLKDPKALKNEAKLRKELKMKRCLELLLHRDKKLTEKTLIKRRILKKTLTFNDKVPASLQKTAESRLLALKVEANKIDEKIQKKEQEERKFMKNLKESSAFPNTSIITPDIVMNLIKNTNNKSKEVENLERFIYTENEKINFQDIHKFLVNEHLKKISDGGTDDVMNYPTKYTLEDEDLGDDEEEENDSVGGFEEKYFTEVSKRREMYFKVDYPVNQSTRKRVKDCCCVIV